MLTQILRAKARGVGRAHVCQPCPCFSARVAAGAAGCWVATSRCPGCPEEGILAGGLSALGEVAASRALKVPRGSRSPSSVRLAGPAGRARGR